MHFAPAARAEPAETLQPELRAYMGRHADSADWNPSFAAAANRFVTRAKAAGWWDRMTAVYFFCAPTQAAALQNIKSDTLPLTLQGGIEFTPYSGMKGDGETGYLDIGKAPGDIPGWSLNAHSMFVFSQSDNPSLAGEIGAMGGGYNIGIRIRDGALLSVWTNNIVAVQLPAGSGYGLTGFVRTSADGGFVTKNGTHTDFLQQPTGMTSGKMRFFRVGISQYHSFNKLAFGFLGDSTITKEQARDIYEACLEMLGDEGMGTLDEQEERLPATPPHAFPRESINQVTPRALRVFRMTGPPASDTVDFTASFAHGPLTDCVTRPWSTSITSTDTQVGRWELIWSDRALGPSPGVNTAWAKKPNDTMGVIKNPAGIYCRTEFTSYEKAIGSTLVKTAYSAGLKFRADPDHPDGKGWGDIAEEWGYDVTAWQARWAADPNDPVFSTDTDTDTGDIVHRKFCAATANVDAFFRHNAVDGVYKTSHDRVILGPGRLADIRMPRGFLIDHEHADSRTPAMELRFLAEMRKIARAKGLGLVASGHVPIGGTGYECGWRADNALELLGQLDWYVIIAGANLTGETLRANLEDQYNFFKGPDGKVPSEKLCVQVQVGAPGQEIQVADMRIIRDFMIGKEIPQCIIVPLYATFGGSIDRMPNQAVATLLGLATEPIARAPEITAHPRDAATYTTGSATFSVAATPNGPVPSCQWYFNNDAGLIRSATATTLTIASARPADAGAYYAKIGNGAFTTISAPATLTVRTPSAPQAIAGLPARQPVVAGRNAALFATISGAVPDATLHWESSDDDGATWTPARQDPVEGSENKITVSATSALYRLVATNLFGSATSAPVRVVAVPELFAQPVAITADAAGTLYVADHARHVIRTISGGTSALLAGKPGETAAALDGTGTAARLKHPGGLVIRSGTLLVADTGNASLRAITADGNVSTLANTGALLAAPTGIAADDDGNIYIADTAAHVIRRRAPDGTLTLVAGAPDASGALDATGTHARFNEPVGLALGADDALYVADTGNHSIRRIALDTTAVVTLAGQLDPGQPGLADGTGTIARFNSPEGLCATGTGALFRIYVADTGNHSIREITAGGAVTTIAGGANTSPGATSPGIRDGSGADAWFDSPSDITLGADGMLYVADTGNAAIRKIDANDNVTTLEYEEFIAPAPPQPPTPPANTSGAGGGGGAPSAWWFCALAMLLFLKIPSIISQNKTSQKTSEK